LNKRSISFDRSNLQIKRILKIFLFIHPLDYSQLGDDEEQSTLTVFVYLQAMQEYGGGVKEMKFKEGRSRALFGD